MNQYTQTSLGAGVQQPKLKFGNMMYKKTFWTGLTDFTQVGSVAPTIVNNAIRFTGGTNDYNNYLTINGLQHSDQNMELELTYLIVTVPAANTLNGIAIGRTSYNAFAAFKTSTAIMDLVGYTSAMLVATNNAISGNVASANYTTMPAVGDLCRIKYSQRENTIFGVYQNFTKGIKNVFSYYVPYALGGATVQLPNASNVAIYNVGGTIDIVGIEVSSQSPLNPYILCIGDSKTVGWGSIDPVIKWANSINQLGLSVVWAGGADNTAEILAGIQNAIKLAPKYVILNIGRNDIYNAVTATVYQANYQSIVSQLQAAGIKVIHLTPIPETTVTQTALDTWVRATYPGQFIDSSISWVNATHLGSDGTHPNVSGHRLLSNTIVNSGLIPSSGQMIKISNSLDITSITGII